MRPGSDCSHPDATPCRSPVPDRGRRQPHRSEALDDRALDTSSPMPSEAPSISTDCDHQASLLHCAARAATGFGMPPMCHSSKSRRARAVHWPGAWPRRELHAAAGLVTTGMVLSILASTGPSSPQRSPSPTSTSGGPLPSPAAGAPSLVTRSGGLLSAHVVAERCSDALRSEIGRRAHQSRRSVDTRRRRISARRYVPEDEKTLKGPTHPLQL